MMTYYSDETLKKLAAEYQSLDGKVNKLFEAYILRSFQNARAREYARQGFARRVRIMLRCVKNFFQLL
ncbi:MAG TPA: hypothetical protein VH678_15680, partial [Xanthobacteraceae bacterium]